jgi:surfeit locus 1 family protein
VAGTLAILLFATFVALGTWQLKRRVWKLDLIARVEQRVHAPPVAAPGPAQWPRVSAATDEYRHVTVTGTFLDESQTLVQAVTELGAGYWVLTPLRTADGSIVMVNRGFIPAEDRDRVARGAVQPRGSTDAAPGGASDGRIATASADANTDTSADANAAPSTTVTGLLRIPEPRGAFLRHNDAAANHWYSRDVQAIAAARGLTHVAPYFIDAEAATPSDGASAAGATSTAGIASSAGSSSATSAAVADTATACRPQSTTANAVAHAACAVVPVAGLTVLTFHNSHLVYAITWYTLALMVAGAIWLGIRSETRT